MSTELQMLVFAGILGLVQLLASAHFTTMQRGVKWNLSSREASEEPLKGAAGRIDRSFRNFMETFAIFAVGVLVLTLTQKNSSLSLWGSQIYFYARLLYFPTYAAGIVGVRTAIWCISLIGLVLVYVSLF